MAIDIIEGIIYMILRGLAIGVVISAPMGPVGILCVQRTLDKGRRTGFYTGVGAALSDLFYCLLTGFGLSFIEEFLEKNENVIQLIGSIVLIAFGLYLFKSNPSRNLRTPSDNKVSAKKNIISGFLFTFSNPLIIFLIIGLFARFNFMSPDFKFYHYIIGFISIIAGALLWWYVVTFFVNKVRAHFNLRSMWLINKIIGSIILFFAIIGIISAVSGMANAATIEPRTVYGVVEHRYYNTERGYSDFKSATNDGLLLKSKEGKRIVDFLDIGNAVALDLEFRAANVSLKSDYGSMTSLLQKSSRDSGWGVMLKNGEQTSFLLFKVGDSAKGISEAYGSKGMQVSLYENGKLKCTKMVTRGVSLKGELNSYKLKFYAGRLTLACGNREHIPLFDCQIEMEDIQRVGFFVDSGSELRVEDICISLMQTNKASGEIRKDRYNISKLSRSKDPLEGNWAVFDRQLQEQSLKLGGDYRVAIVREDDIYLMIYISGAEKNSNFWEEGMVKAIITPFPVKNVYHVKWILSNGEELDTDVRAQLDENLLTLSFPSYNSTLRLHKYKSN